jgi:glycosyltransferase involved in cell wall biosynthesis
MYQTLEDGLERIAIVSEDISRPVDEGFKKATVRLAAGIKHLVPHTAVFTQAPQNAAIDAEALPVNKLLWGATFARRLKDLAPQATLYIPQAAATPMSILRAACIKRQSGGKPIVLLSLQQRTYPALARPFLKAIRPDLALVLSTSGLQPIRGIGCRARRVPLGVDSEVFKPPGPGAREALRTKYGLPDGRLILHVGHISRGRNLEVLGRIADETTKVLVISSTATRRDPEVEAMLRRPGVVLIDRYIDNIEEIYRLADGYVFPTWSASDAIDVPLSVLEAMATNLPVATTAFGGLPDLFKPGEGLFMCFTEDDLVEAVRRMAGAASVATRDKVIGLSWANAAESILEAMELELR